MFRMEVDLFELLYWELEAQGRITELLLVGLAAWFLSV